MSEMLARAGAGSAAAGPVADTQEWDVRAARHDDLPGVAAGVSALLGELGATSPPHAVLEDAARLLLDDSPDGALLVAVAGERIVGVLDVSWTHAIRTTGRHGVIQELWVDPGWRSQRVGAALLDRLAGLARARGIRRLEVGLPTTRFESLVRTRSFYAESGFEPLGERMRLTLS
jgi:GNAT superfamily N-acetyltransferase